jgi:hypothetical protein
MVKCSCHPSSVGGINGRITVPDDLEEKDIKPYLKITISKKSWGHDSSGRALAKQA